MVLTSEGARVPYSRSDSVSSLPLETEPRRLPVQGSTVAMEEGSDSEVKLGERQKHDEVFIMNGQKKNWPIKQDWKSFRATYL